jgi:ADP-L-glycero-D-manno-heptose 6-epimerase
VYSLDDAEWHKGDQASPHYKFKQQALRKGHIEVFEGSETFYRDFVDVDTVCHVQYEMSSRSVGDIYDLGSGKQTSFMQVAEKIASQHNAHVITIPFPEKLKGCYQTNTLANMSYF